MADEPVTAWREPFSRRARRWARRNRTAVTALAASVLVALAGTAAVLAVQTRANAELKQANLDLAMANDLVTQANADLKSANDREKQRFSLAMDAIKLFHGEVSEDLLVKEKQFEGQNFMSLFYLSSQSAAENSHRYWSFSKYILTSNCLLSRSISIATPMSVFTKRTCQC